MSSANGPPIFLAHSGQSPTQVLTRLTEQDSLPTPAPFIYLGRNYLLLTEWQQGLGSRFERISYAAELQDLAQRSVDPYLQWLAELGTRYDSLRWWLSRIAERNIAIDTMFHKVCYLQIALDKLKGQAGSVLVVAESPAVLRTLQHHPGIAGRCRALQPTSAVRPWAGWARRAARGWIAYLKSSAAMIKAARADRGSGTAPASHSAQPLVLLHTHIDETYFGEDGTPRDRYFTVLPDELRQRGYRVMVLPWLYSIDRSRAAAYEWFRSRPGEYLIPEDYYSWADYIWSGWIVLSLAWLLRGRHSFRGQDVGLLVREACLEQSVDMPLAEFARYYRLIRKLRDADFKVDVFLSTFENMVFEKPLVLGFRRYLPGVLTVGFQHYLSLYRLWICGLTTPREAAIAPHHDVIVCSSPFLRRQLLQAGFPPQKLRVGASLRQLHLGQLPDQRSPEPQTVLVVLSLDPQATAELLSKLLLAFPAAEGITFWIKTHPMMSASGITPFLPPAGFPAHMTVVSGPMSDWLPRAACAVVVASTSSLELALAGVPVASLGRETDFDLNPLAWFPERDQPVHAPEELRAQVLRLLSLSPNEQASLMDWACRWRTECVSPLDDETMLAYVQPLSHG